MAGGYMGKLLRVDLTKRHTWEEELDPEVARRYIGGSGLAASICMKRLMPVLIRSGRRICLFS